MATLSTHNTILCLSLVLLAGFAYLQPVGYLGSGLIGAIGAKLLTPKDNGDPSGFHANRAVSVLRVTVIGFCIILTVGRHFGFWSE